RNQNPNFNPGGEFISPPVFFDASQWRAELCAADALAELAPPLPSLALRVRLSHWERNGDSFFTALKLFVIRTSSFVIRASPLNTFFLVHFVLFVRANLS